MHAKYKDFMSRITDFIQGLMFCKNNWNYNLNSVFYEFPCYQVFVAMVTMHKYLGIQNYVFVQAKQHFWQNNLHLDLYLVTKTYLQGNVFGKIP